MDRIVIIVGRIVQTSEKDGETSRSERNPDSMRATAWQVMSGALPFRRDHAFISYTVSIAGPPSSHDTHTLQDLVNNKDTPIMDIIRRDIHRTYPDHVLFRTSDGQGYVH